MGCAAEGCFKTLVAGSGSQGAASRKVRGGAADPRREASRRKPGFGGKNDRSLRFPVPEDHEIRPGPGCLAHRIIDEYGARRTCRRGFRTAFPAFGWHV